MLKYYSEAESKASSPRLSIRSPMTMSACGCRWTSVIVCFFDSLNGKRDTPLLLLHFLHNSKQELKQLRCLERVVLGCRFMLVLKK